MDTKLKAGDLAIWHTTGESHKVFVDAVYLPDEESDDWRDRIVTYGIVSIAAVQKKLNCTEEGAIKYCVEGLNPENRIEYCKFLNSLNSGRDSGSHWAYDEQLRYIGSAS